MILNAHAGTRYGIPFPVYCRASFGLRGGQRPGHAPGAGRLRVVGIQCWIAGAAIATILAIFRPIGRHPPLPSIGLSPLQLACFPRVLGGQHAGGGPGGGLDPNPAEHQGALAHRARAGPAGLGLPRGARLRADAGAALGVRGRGAEAGQFWTFFFPGPDGDGRFWATLSLNIPDFSRYAYTQRDQMSARRSACRRRWGSSRSIGVAVTSATATIYGETIWDPVVLLSKFRDPVVLALAMGALCLATRPRTSRPTWSGRQTTSPTSGPGGSRSGSAA